MVVLAFLQSLLSSEQGLFRFYPILICEMILHAISYSHAAMRHDVYVPSLECFFIPYNLASSVFRCPIHPSDMMTVIYLLYFALTKIATVSLTFYLVEHSKQFLSNFSSFFPQA